MAKPAVHKAKPSPPSPFADIGGVLLSFMEEKGIDGARLARLSGVSESEVYNVLKNRRTRSGLKTLQKLSAPLGKTLADIFHRLAHEDAGNIKKLEKEPAFVMEYRRHGVTIFSDAPPYPEFFIGRISILGGTKGYANDGTKQNCMIFLRILKGGLELTYCGKVYPLATYQKIVFNAKYGFQLKNRNTTEPGEALMVTAPSLWATAPV